LASSRKMCINVDICVCVAVVVKYVGAAGGRAYRFFSTGFKTLKEHIKDSSTIIMAAALSNSPQ